MSKTSNWLYRNGLSNYDSEDIGALASGKPLEDKPRAFCSSLRCQGGSVVMKEIKVKGSPDRCPDCGNFLFYKRVRKETQT